MEAERILITGGAGYLGSVITAHFLKHKDSITCVDTLRYGQQSPLQFMSDHNFTFVYGDVRDRRLMCDLVPKHDVILPLAAIVGAPACDLYPEDASSINRDAVIMLNGLRSKEQKLVYPTTNSGYGTTTGEIECTEESLLNPISLYGKTKAAAECALLEDSKPCIAFRLATIFGMSPRPRLDLLVNDLTYRALSTRKIELFEKGFMRNFVHIKDVARVFDFALTSYDRMARTRLYNVGNPELNISKEQLVQRIASQVSDLKITEDTSRNDPDQRNYIVSNLRLDTEGFCCLETLEQGISEIINAYPLLSTPAVQNISYNNRSLS